MLKYLLKEMRVHHYIKNFLVYAALVCSGKFFDAEKLMPATLILWLSVLLHQLSI